MLRALDLAAIAEEIDTAYRPVPLATLGQLEMSLFICQGRAPWQRRYESDELLFVLEGVITLENAQGAVVVNEGEVAAAPAARGYNAHSGMRSTVVLVEDLSAPTPSLNGHSPPAPELPATLPKFAAAVAARRAPVYSWLPTGSAGAYSLMASRLAGESLPYRLDGGPGALLVYRGVLDYRADGGAGTVVGSHMLVIPAGTELALDSERGATVLFLAPTGCHLPTAAAPGAAAPPDAAGPDAGPTTDPGSEPEA